MVKTTFRATISGEDLKWIQDYKQENNYQNNAEVLHCLMESAKKEKI